MGWLRKLTGVQGQIDAARSNADATNRATEQAAAGQSAALNAAAAATAQQQAIITERQAAEQKAAAIVSAPLATAEVTLNESATSGASTKARRARRTAFGRNYQSGVSI
jgi:hypothetical protein